MLQFGPLELPPEAAPNHFLFVGTTGSGKSTLMRILEQTAFRNIEPGEDIRAMVYDAKQDTVPQLVAMAPHAEILITNPFDRRGIAWDLCRDIREPQVAIEIAFTLIPSVAESQPFFSDASRNLVYGVILSFMLTGREWTLADLIRVVHSRRLLMGVLRKHDETRDLIGQYLKDKRLAANILSTMATKFLPFGPVAAAWEHADRKVSLTEWSTSHSIWVLGNSEISRTPLQALNRCMFKRASDITLNSSESATRRNWFVVDEISDAGRLDGLVSLAKKGRSKGAVLAIAFQSAAGLRDANLYGQHFTEEILAQFGHRFIGRLECATTAEWASLLVGDHEVEQTSTCETKTSGSGQSSSSRSVTTQTNIRRALLPSEIMNFIPCNRQNGLSGLFFTPEIGAFQDHLEGDELFEEALLPAADIPAFERRPVKFQLMKPWTKEREQLFCAPPKSKKRTQGDGAVDEFAGLNPATEDYLDDLFT